MQGELLGRDGLSRIQHGMSAFLNMGSRIRNKPVRLNLSRTIAARMAGMHQMAVVEGPIVLVKR